jgi:hypothetical protein
MRTLLATALIATLLISLAPAASEFASAPPTSAAAATQGAQTRDSTPIFTTSSRPEHTARVVRMVRASRRSLQARHAYEPVTNAAAAGESSLERRRADLPSKYFLLHYRTAPRAPARG